MILRGVALRARRSWPSCCCLTTDRSCLVAKEEPISAFVLFFRPLTMPFYGFALIFTADFPPAVISCISLFTGTYYRIVSLFLQQTKSHLLLLAKHRPANICAGFLKNIISENPCVFGRIKYSAFKYPLFVVVTGRRNDCGAEICSSAALPLTALVLRSCIDEAACINQRLKSARASKLD